MPKEKHELSESVEQQIEVLPKQDKIDLRDSQSIDNFQITSTDAMLALLQTVLKEFLKGVFTQGNDPAYNDYRVLMEISRNVTDLLKFIEAREYEKLMDYLMKEATKKKKGKRK